MTNREIFPGHGKSGVHKARQALMGRLYVATEKVLGPSKPWTMSADMQEYPYFHVREDHPNDMPCLEVRFTERTTLWLNLWSSGPGFYEPAWYYETSECDDFMCGDPQLSQMPATKFTDALRRTLPPEKADTLLSAWAVVLADVRVVES